MFLVRDRFVDDGLLFILVRKVLGGTFVRLLALYQPSFIKIGCFSW